MNRREFLKLGTLFAAAMAVETSPVLKAAAKLAESNPFNVVFYKVKKISNGKWYLKGTKFVDLPKKAIDTKIYDADSFTLISIVDNAEAHEIRKTLWKEHGCQPVKVFGTYDIQHRVRIGKKGAVTNRNSGQIDEWTQIGKEKRQQMVKSGEWSKIAAKGGKIQGPINAQNGHMQNIQKQGTIESAKVRANNGIARRLEKNKMIYNAMEYGVWYTRTEISELVGPKMWRQWHKYDNWKEFSMFQKQFNGHGVSTLYKKI